VSAAWTHRPGHPPRTAAARHGRRPCVWVGRK